MKLNPRRDSVKPASERPRNLDDLAEVPRWVAWREETRKRNDGSEYTTKIPYDPNGNGKARVPTDPATWDTRNRAERRWRELDHGKPGGVGIVLGDLDKGYHLLGLDLDKCVRRQSKDAVTLKPFANEIIERFRTYTEISPSGKGAKLFFLVAASDMPAVQQLLGFDAEHKPNTRKTFAAGEHREVALDRARFYAVTNDAVEAWNFRVVPTEDVRWLIEDAGPRFLQKYRQPSEERASDARPHDQTGSGFGWRFFCDCKARGWSFEQAWEAIFRDPDKAGEWANRTELRELVRTWERAKPIRFADVHPKRQEWGPAFTAKDLQTMIFEPLKYVVPDLITEGLTLFVGRPKIGKSFLVLQVADAVAGGLVTLGRECKPGDVLYCALEDNARRLQSRLGKMQITDWSAHLHFRIAMPRLDEGGIDFIRDWVRSVRRPRLVIIDTFKRVRPLGSGRGTQYEEDYDSLVPLHDLAQELGIAIVVVHHDRKASADDPFDTVSGTLGLNAVVDSVMVLVRDPSGAMILHQRGRDLDEVAKAMRFDRNICYWKMLGNAAEVQRSHERAQVLKAMQAIGEPAKPAEIAREADAPVNSVTKLLARMARAGDIRKPTYGKYSLDQAREA